MTALRLAFVCGSRKTPQSPHRAILRDALDKWYAGGTLGACVTMEGGCDSGPDAWCEQWGRVRGVHNLAIHALWDFQRERGTVGAAGPIRNAIMRDVLAALRAGGAHVTCFAMPYGKASGTRGMMTLLEAADFAVEVLGG